MATEQTFQNRPLDRLELEILHGIPNGGVVEPRAYAVWQGWEGIEMGPVRFRSERQGDTWYSVSPFPGAWTDVRESAIIRVRHLGAMSL